MCLSGFIGSFHDIYLHAAESSGILDALKDGELRKLIQKIDSAEEPENVIYSQPQLYGGLFLLIKIDFWMLEIRPMGLSIWLLTQY